MKKFLALFVIVAGLALAQNPVVAKFPAEVVTDRDLFVAKNVPRPAVTLTAPVDATTTTFPVTDGTQFRDYQVIGVDLEMMQVCSTTPSSIEVCERGLAGTTPTEHSAGAVVSVPLADVHLNRFAAEIKAIQTALGSNLSNITGLVTGYVQGAGNLTNGGRAVMVSSAGVVTQSAAQFNASGSLFIPYGQTITFYGTNNNTALRHNNNSFWIWGAYNGVTQMALGEGTTHDDVIHFAYTRGTKGAGQGSLRIGQLSKTDPNWTHGITAFHTLGQERMRINASGNVLIGTETDDESGAKLQVEGAVKAGSVTTQSISGLTTPLSIAQGGTGASTEEQARANIGLGNVENVALSAWTGSTNITTIGALNSHVKAPKQINFTLYDPNTSIPASTIPGIWRAEYGNITATAVSCSADTGDAVIQFTGIALSGNLTCSSGGWATSTSFSTATLAQGGSIGLQVVSGTAKRINVSIKYNQQ